MCAKINKTSCIQEGTNCSGSRKQFHYLNLNQAERDENKKET